MTIDIDSLLALPPAERQRLAELLWASLESAREADSLPPEQRRELEYRLAQPLGPDEQAVPVDVAIARLRHGAWRGD